MRIMELSAAIALVLKPEAAADYLKKLGVDIDLSAATAAKKEDDALNVYEDPLARLTLKQDLS